MHEAGRRSRLIGKIKAAHGSFKKLVEYVMRDVESERRERLSVGTLVGRDASSLVQSGAAWRKALGTEKTGKDVLHLIMAIRPGERLSADEWGREAELAMERLGYANSPWFAVKHEDRNHQHIHIVGIRYDRDTGLKVKESFSKRRLRSHLDEREKALGLSKCSDRGPPSSPQQRAPSTGEWRIRQREPTTVDPRQAIWRALEQAKGLKPEDLPTLGAMLERQGVRLVPTVSRTTDRIFGLRYVHEPTNRSFTARELGDAAMLPALEDDGLRRGDLGLLRGMQAYDKYGLQLPPRRPSETKAVERWVNFRDEIIASGGGKTPSSELPVPQASGTAASPLPEPEQPAAEPAHPAAAEPEPDHRSARTEAPGEPPTPLVLVPAAQTSLWTLLQRWWGKVTARFGWGEGEAEAEGDTATQGHTTSELHPSSKPFEPVNSLAAARLPEWHVGTEGDLTDLPRQQHHVAYRRFDTRDELDEVLEIGHRAAVALETQDGIVAAFRIRANGEGLFDQREQNFESARSAAMSLPGYPSPAPFGPTDVRDRLLWVEDVDDPVFQAAQRLAERALDQERHQPSKARSRGRSRDEPDIDV